jgi:hypothetical protein
MLNLLLTLGSNFLLPVIGAFIPAAWNFIKTHWKSIIFDLLILCLGFSVYSCHSIKGDLVKEKAAHAADTKTFKAAQAQADKNAQAQKTKLETEGKQKADDADKNYSSLLSKYNASLMRYKQANQGSAGTSGYSQLQSPQSGDGPGQSPFVSIPVDDAGICAENTARLQAVHDWATHLGELK